MPNERGRALVEQHSSMDAIYRYMHNVLEMLSRLQSPEVVASFIRRHRGAVLPRERCISPFISLRQAQAQVNGTVAARQRRDGEQRNNEHHDRLLLRQCLFNVSLGGSLESWDWLADGNVKLGVLPVHCC